jgi:meiotically up-regulated gene 157 (Mug157) protein
VLLIFFRFVKGLTSTSDDEIKDCLEMLKTTTAGTGFMHESFWKVHGSTETLQPHVMGRIWCELSSLTAGVRSSYVQDDASTFTRAWFAWANSLFGEFILTVAQQRPHLIFRP